MGDGVPHREMVIEPMLDMENQTSVETAKEVRGPMTFTSCKDRAAFEHLRDIAACSRSSTNAVDITSARDGTANAPGVA